MKLAHFRRRVGGETRPNAHFLGAKNRYHPEIALVCDSRGILEIFRQLLRTFLLGDVFHSALTKMAVEKRLNLI